MTAEKFLLIRISSYHQPVAVGARVETKTSLFGALVHDPTDFATLKEVLVGLQKELNINEQVLIINNFTLSSPCYPTNTQFLC